MRELKKRILIDCDPSADDAIALMLALRSPELCVEGITVVAGVCEVENCAENALKVLRMMGREDVPVALGAAQPLCRELIFDGKYCGPDGLSETALPPSGLSPVSEPAVEFLHRKLTEEEGLHILSIAPMTNLAMLLRRYPEIKDRIASVITTSGSYGVAPDKRCWDPRPSWNIQTDPEAAKCVLESGIPVFALGLDVTTRLSNAITDRLLSEGNPDTPAYAFLERAAAFNRAHRLEPYSLLVDSMGAAAAAVPELAEMIEGQVLVCADDSLMCGQTLFGTKGYLLRGSRSQLSAARIFDFERYTDLLLERVFS